MGTLILLGPPGAGKGTQAERLSQELSLPHISSGDIFRANLKEQTGLGRQARAFMDRGDLVPDEITIAMIRERLRRPDCQGGAVLDGFPRTPAQAQALEGILADLNTPIEAALYIRVPNQTLVERLAGRWICQASGHIFHDLNNPPRERGRCDLDGSELYQREDDQPEVVARRVQVYHEQTAPLIQHYRQRGLLVEVDGSRSFEQVTTDLLRAIAVNE